MSLPDFTLVRLSFRQHLLDFLGSEIPLEHFCWENRPFTPPPMEPPLPWIRETLLITKDGHLGLDLLEALGEFRWDIFYPVNRGTEIPESLQLRIASSFEKKGSLTSQGIGVGLERITRPMGRQLDEHWWMGSVVISWRTYTSATPVLLRG